MAESSNASSAAAAGAAAAAEAEEAKAELTACEREILKIRAGLRSITTMSAGGDVTTDSDNDGEGGADGRGSADLNALSVAWIQTEGLPAEVVPELKLQLSSPIEELVLSKLYDPLDEADNALAVAVFRGVETGQATLVVAAYSKTDNVSLGTSTLYDVAILTKFDALNPKQHYETDLKLEILPEPSSETKTATEETEDGGGDDDDDEAKKEQAAAATAAAAAAAAAVAAASTPVCTVSLRVTYTPSLKDRREELYELLNKATQRKAAAVEKLRRSAMAASRSSSAAAAGSSGSGIGEGSSKTPATSSTVAKPSARPNAAVKPGFLNKSAKKELDEPSRLWTFYERNLGPNSLMRKIVPLAKNYVIFFAFVCFMHFKGQLLALPPPV